MRLTCFLLTALLSAAAMLPAQPTRPAITSISHMCVYASDLKASDDFYSRILGAAKAADPDDPKGSRYYFSATQFVEVLPLPANHGISRMACVAYNTADASAMRQYLRSRDVQSVGEMHTGEGGTRWFETKDPEGNVVRFVQPGQVKMPLGGDPIGTKIIHVGYMVRNRAEEDHFYREILGFRPYWFGGMHADHVDWISQQVPDGHDWLEYMMVGEGSGVPESHVDARQLGVMNHFSIGVPNMEQAVAKLYRENRLPQKHDGPQMGKDGKWQANWYDPDGTRVELMEFQPVMQPCCSAFTAESPIP